jgi:hypothetical protein
VKVKFLFGDALAATADVGSGLMIGTVLGTIYDHCFWLRWPWIYLIAIFCALLPDFDLLLKAIEAKLSDGSDSHHRTILHQPLWFGAVFVLWLVLALLLHWPFIWPLIFAAGTFSHFVHDSLGEYDEQNQEFNIGVPWLSPFRHETFVLFGRVDGKTRILVIKPVGFSGMEHKRWLRTLYLRMNQRLVKEMGWFVLWLAVAMGRIASH